MKKIGCRMEDEMEGEARVCSVMWEVLSSVEGCRFGCEEFTGFCYVKGLESRGIRVEG